jgi:2-polyprenyl-3-methyl-5-hydroxy-6-metoxy-1,4-benzoquinol methylase
MEQWPDIDLESVDACPMCGSGQAVLKHEAVRDWSFFSAPGQWNYWQCGTCQGLYLNPRPTLSSISRAYSKYYTHAGPGAQTGVRSLKVRWKNERLSARFGRPIEPRLQLPGVLNTWVARRASVIALPFGWQELAQTEPGQLMDVGCGTGATLVFAKALGWDVKGLELDPSAVDSAQAAGLEVGHGGYERLAETESAFDCITCSHVIEHVFDPRHMVQAIFSALRPGGRLVLSTPNALSDVHRHFGKHWRGLEAPRHLFLYSERHLSSLLRDEGFRVESKSDQELATVIESARIARGGRQVSGEDRAAARRISQRLQREQQGHDFIKLVAFKP